MKLTLILLFAFVFCLHAEKVTSQNAPITLHKSNASLEQVLGEIEKQSNYLFIYNKHVDAKRNVSVNATKKPLKDVLHTLLEGTNITFDVEGSYIILSGKEKSEMASVNQQAITIVGTVTDEFGDGMPGVNIIVKGTTTGTVTDFNGRYTIDVPESNTTLSFSFLGYATVEKVVGTQRTIDVAMKEDARQIDEVVVTALGIVKKEKSLTYSTQIVDGNELTRAKDPNMINSLAGKTAGVQINRSGSGLGGSVKVVIRGNRSVTGSNQPLYVIDGVPINSSASDLTATTIGGNNDAGNRDGGDGISNLNPDDIESMNILKGPAAAALYGSSAANGVVVITTKKGKTGRMDVTFNSSTTWETAAHGKPKFQNSFGGVTTSWGDPINGSPDYLDMYFKTGMTTINSVSFSAGTETMQTYFSYANTFGKGIVENNQLKKHNLNFRETAQFFDKKLTIDANINLMYQDVDNRPSPGGFYLNPLVGVYRFPRGGVQGGESFAYYKENYRRHDPERNMYLQNWYTEPSSWEQNPFWLTNMLPNEEQRYRTIANLSVSYKINSMFTVQARGNADVITDNYEMKMYAGTHTALTGGNNGRYITNESNSMNIYGDVMLTYQQQIKNFSFNASLGASINDVRGKSIELDSYPGGMYFPNMFGSANMDLNGGSPSLNKYRGQEQAVFFAGQVGFRDWLFLDVTARNDWTSTLAFTKYKNKGFFYPSVGLTWVMNESLKLPEWINLGKIRAAWSRVGNGLPRYRSNPLHSIRRGGLVGYNTTAPYNELKPEMTTSYEFGTEWRLFHNRLEFDFTYYQTNTKNQLFTLDATSGSKWNTFYANAGDIRNRGIEIMLSGTPVVAGDFRWKTGLNYALNRNKVLELAEGLGHFAFAESGSNSYDMRLEVGGSFGDIYGRTFLRKEGNIQYDDDGIPMPDKSDYKKLGNTSPKYNLGWQNTFTYKGISLYLLFDGRFGGDVISLTQAELDKYGVSKVTGQDRLNNGLQFDGKKIQDVERFYSIVGGRDGITEHYVYNATNIRLRELSIGYALPQQWLRNTPVKGVDISLIGRNLFFIKNDAPYDPDGTLSVGNNLQGVDVFGMPSTRSFGFNLKVKF